MLRRSFLKLLPVAALPITAGVIKATQQPDQSWICAKNAQCGGPTCRFCGYVQCVHNEGETNHIRFYIYETHRPKCKRFKFNHTKTYLNEEDA